MAHLVIPDITSTVEIQPGAVVSRVILRDGQTEVTVFGFAAGEGLSEHQASRAAIVHLLKGRLEFVADGERLDAEPGFWLQDGAGNAPQPHRARAGGHAPHPGRRGVNRTALGRPGIPALN
jgi:quercetin dioxygenase-like cupin family protein